MSNEPVSAAKALAKLKEGNARYLTAERASGDVSQALVHDLSENGQHPYAVVVACSDSRVVPEHIFSCGLGELFCIRTAGNVVGPAELASVVYAADHLHAQLVVLMGHTGCGAVEAAMAGGAEGPVSAVTDPIARAIGDERDACAASALNVRAGLATLSGNEELQALEGQGLRIVGALYHTDSGRVQFFE